MNPAETGEKFIAPQVIDGQKVKAFITWLGFQINDESVNLVDLVDDYMREVARLACGECGVGYNGVRVISSTLERMTKGHGTEGDIDLLVSLADGIHLNAACDFCRQAVKPLMDTLAFRVPAFEAAVKNGMVIKKQHYITNVTAPCMEACPIHQDVPGYIQLTRNGRYDDALEVIRRTNCLPGVLGRTCVAFCEKNCVRNDIDAPLAIRALKRVPADLGKKTPVQKEMANDVEVSIIGCGPGGLAAADYLSARGYKVNIADDQASPGGMAAVGIPSYRLPRSVINGDVDEIVSLGTDIELNRRLNNISEPERAKVVLVATGAHISKAAGIEGWSDGCAGCLEGVKYLADVNSGKPAPAAENIIIVGGGNTAIDCARTAVRTGAREVTVLYRRSRVEMPARADEVDAAEKEGVRFRFLALPVRLITESDRVMSVECQRMELGEPDASGRRRPIPLKGSEFVIPADLVLTAIGEAPGLSLLPQGVELTAWGSIKTDEAGRSSKPWLFAAGDCATGPATIVEAMAGGRRAARSIEDSVNGQEAGKKSVAEQLHELGMERKRFGASPSTRARLQPEEINEEARKNTFDEVEMRFGSEAAVKEASRCLRCYRVMVAIS